MNPSRPSIDYDPLKKIGVIGCGFIFKTFYSPILQSLSDRLQVTCVCDLRSNLVQGAVQAHPGARAYLSVHELLVQESLDAVLVLTTEVNNAPITAAALEKRIAVYLEKPPALSMSEWHELRNQEVRSGRFIYTAFNRRHTPFIRWETPARLRKIRGRMVRRGRPVHTFPFTAVHLIDAATYFSGMAFAQATPTMERDGTRWRISGRMTNGAECELIIVPDGAEHAEFLVFEGDETSEMYFPNPEADQYREGRLTCGSRLYPLRQPISDPIEVMGFAPCFRTFLDLLEKGGESGSPHRLASCESTIKLLEEMLGQSARC